MKYFIRPYQPADLQSCRALWEELTGWHRQLYHDDTIGGENPGEAFDRYLASPALAQVWVAEAEGRVIGFTGLLVYGEEAEIEPVIVHQETRSQGIGTALLEAVIAEARSRQVRFLSLRPVARNVKAITFFVEMGFQMVGQIDLFQDLASSSKREWLESINLHGHRLKY